MRAAVAISPGDQSTCLTNKIAAQAASGSHPGRLRATNRVCQSQPTGHHPGNRVGKSQQGREDEEGKEDRPCDAYQPIDESGFFGIGSRLRRVRGYHKGSVGSCNRATAYTATESRARRIIRINPSGCMGRRAGVGYISGPLLGHWSMLTSR